MHIETSTLPSAQTALATQQAAYEKSLTFWQTLRIFWRSTLWIMYGQLVVFSFGIDGVIAGYLLAVPRFRQDYGTTYIVNGAPAYIIPANKQALYNGISQLTAIIGALITGTLADAIGRRATNLLFCVISVGGVAAQFWSNGSLEILTVGKAINGFSIGAWLIIGPLYASEVAPLKLRGWLTSITNIVQFSGVLLFTGIIYAIGAKDSKSSYLILFGSQWVIPSIVILTVYFWPESPVWLCRVKKPEQAKAALRRIHGSDNEIDIEGIFAQIQDTIAHEDATKEATSSASYLECFKGADRRRTLICMFVYGCQYLSGIVFVLGYQSYYYQLIGYSAKKSFLLGMLNNTFQFIANILSWFLIDIAGRRPLIVWGQLLCAVALFIIGGTSLPGTYAGYLTTVCFMFVWGFIYQLTLGTVAWSVVAELASFRLKSRTQGLANFVLCLVQWTVGFTFPYMFNPDQGNLGGKVGFIFGATTFIGFLGVFFWLPETKGRTSLELDELFERKVSARHFCTTKTNLEEEVEGDKNQTG
ncbi:general substrate transporter [Cadophora sp. DSE1049]|nr:general substrate transporter [Cadophora sp. DSE1049]